jgi:hypothetical protein
VRDDPVHYIGYHTDGNGETDVLLSLGAGEFRPTCGQSIQCRGASRRPSQVLLSEDRMNFLGHTQLIASIAQQGFLKVRLSGRGCGGHHMGDARRVGEVRGKKREVNRGQCSSH